MKSRLILLMLCFSFLILLPNTTAYLGEFPPNEPVNIKVLSNCSSVSLTSVETKDQEFILNAPMQNIGGQTFNYSFPNTSKYGEYRYTWTESCVDCSGGVCGNNFTIGSSITPTTYIFLLIFFSSLIVGFAILSRKVNFAKWENKIVQKYETKNPIKAIIATLGYGLLKDTFLIYYFLGIPIIYLIRDMLYTAQVDAFTPLMDGIFTIYLIGLVVVGIYFFGKLIEFIRNTIDKVSDKDWGIGDD